MNEGSRSHGHRLQIMVFVLHCLHDFVRGGIAQWKEGAVTSRRPVFETALAHLVLSGLVVGCGCRSGYGYGYGYG